MKKYYPSIQILRGVLFLFILAFHSKVPYTNFGWGGVESFFVISSFFLVHKQWRNDTLNVKEQIRHRITRLYPPYFAVLLVAALYALLVKKIPCDMIAHLLSAQNFQWMITGYKSPMKPMTAHTWTLSIEVWVGLVMLILLKMLTKERFKIAMYVMFGIGICYRLITIICGANVYVVSLCPLAHFDAFASGALLAICLREKKVEGYKIGLLSVLGIIGIIICILLMAHWNSIGFLDGYKLLSSSENYLNNWFTGNIYLFISLLTVGFVGLLCLHDEKMVKMNNVVRSFVTLGDNSYVLYLFHWPILVVIRYLVQNWAIVFVTTFIVSIIAALIFCRLYSAVSKRLLGGK